MFVFFLATICSRLPASPMIYSPIPITTKVQEMQQRHAAFNERCTENLHLLLVYYPERKAQKLIFECLTHLKEIQTITNEYCKHKSMTIYAKKALEIKFDERIYSSCHAIICNMRILLAEFYMNDKRMKCVERIIDDCDGFISESHTVIL